MAIGTSCPGAVQIDLSQGATQRNSKSTSLDLSAIYRSIPSIHLASHQHIGRATRDVPCSEPRERTLLALGELTIGRVTMLSRVGNLTNQLTPPAGMVVADLGDVADNGDIHVPARGG